MNLLESGENPAISLLGPGEDAAVESVKLIQDDDSHLEEQAPPLPLPLPCFRALKQHQNIFSHESQLSEKVFDIFRSQLWSGCHGNITWCISQSFRNGFQCLWSLFLDFSWSCNQEDNTVSFSVSLSKQ